MSISLVNMTKDDLLFVNSVRNLDSTRQQLENQSVISMKDTLLWFKEQSPKWKIVKNETGTDIGYVRTSKDTGITICIGCDIHPDYRRLGYATKVYNKFLESLYEEGYRVIWLRCFSDNAARFMYEKLGFIKVNQEPLNDREYFTMVHTR